MTINISGYSHPIFIAESTLFDFFGDVKGDFVKPVSLAQVKDFIGHLPLDDEDEENEISILQAIELVLSSIVPEYSATHSINNAIGAINRYTNRADGSLITSFRMSAIFCDADGKLFYKLGSGDDAYTVPLVFNGTSWNIPGTKLTGQSFRQDDNKRLDNGKAKTSFLTGLVKYGDETHEITTWINCGLLEKKDRDADKGNLKAAKLLNKKIFADTVDFSDCVRTESSGGGGYKTDTTVAFSGYWANNLKEIVLEVTELIKEVMARNDGTGDFAKYSVRVNPESFPEGLTIFYPDFSKPLSTAGTFVNQQLPAALLGILEIKSAKLIHSLYKQTIVEDAKIQLPTAEAPWYLHIKRPIKSNQVHPSVEPWARSIDRCNDTVRSVFQAQKSIGYWGNVEIQDMTIEAVSIDMTEVDQFVEEDEEPEIVVPTVRKLNAKKAIVVVAEEVLEVDEDDIPF